MEHLRDSMEGIPIVDFGEYSYFIHPLTDGIPYIGPELLRDVSNEIVRRVDFDPVDRILAPEAMGLPLATALSIQVDVPMTVIRKRSYGLDGEINVAQVTGYDENELYINGIEAGHRVVVVDDVVSTGGTLSAVTDALAAIGADLERFITVFDKREDPSAPRYDDVPVDALLRVAVVGDRVEIHGR